MGDDETEILALRQVRALTKVLAQIASGAESPDLLARGVLMAIGALPLGSSATADLRRLLEQEARTPVSVTVRP